MNFTLFFRKSLGDIFLETVYWPFELYTNYNIWLNVSFCLNKISKKYLNKWKTKRCRKGHFSVWFHCQKIRPFFYYFDMCFRRWVSYYSLVLVFFFLGHHHINFVHLWLKCLLVSEDVPTHCCFAIVNQLPKFQTFPKAKGTNLWALIPMKERLQLNEAIQIIMETRNFINCSLAVGLGSFPTQGFSFQVTQKQQYL